MNKSIKFFIVLIVIILAVSFWFVNKKNIPDKQEVNNPPITIPKAEQTFKTYFSDRYDFSFKYPDPYVISESSDEDISIGRESISSTEPLVAVYLLKSSPEIEIQSFEEFVLDAARLACSIETSSSLQSCTRIDDVVKIAPFTTSSGIKGQVFYLRGEEKNNSTGKTSNIRRGPFYTFNTSSNTPNRMSFVMVGNPVTKSPEEANLDLIKSVALSIDIN